MLGPGPFIPSIPSQTLVDDVCECGDVISGARRTVAPTTLVAPYYYIIITICTIPSSLIELGNALGLGALSKYSLYRLCVRFYGQRDRLNISADDAWGWLAGKAAAGWQVCRACVAPGV